MNKPKVTFEEKSRQITVTYHIDDREEDMLMGINLISIAQEKKIYFTTYEDNYNTRCFILKGTNIKQLKQISQQLEKPI